MLPTQKEAVSIKLINIYELLRRALMLQPLNWWLINSSKTDYSFNFYHYNLTNISLFLLACSMHFYIADIMLYAFHLFFPLNKWVIPPSH